MNNLKSEKKYENFSMTNCIGKTEQSEIREIAEEIINLMKKKKLSHFQAEIVLDSTKAILNDLLI